MFVYQAGVLLSLPRCPAAGDGQLHRVSQRAGTPVTDRLLPESAAAQARSLEGRPLAMYSSLMLPDRSRLRLSESWPHSASLLLRSAILESH